jgi:hypothetical protein
MKQFLLTTALLVALVAPGHAEENPTKHPPDVGITHTTFKKSFTMKPCMDRVANVVRNHTGSGLRIDPLPSGTGLIGDEINIVIQCAPDLKAILFMAASPKTDLIGQTLTFYQTIFELEVKELGGERK